MSFCISFSFLALLLALAVSLLSSSFLDSFFFDVFFLSSLEESSESLEEEDSKYEEKDEEEPWPFFFFFCLADLRAAFAFVLLMRPGFARRRTIPPSVFLCYFFFLRWESFSASVSIAMKLTVSLVIRGVVEFPIDVR